MEKINEAVRYFLDNYMVYDNPFDVEIIASSDDSVMVATDWPGENNNDGYNLELFFECSTMEEFIEIFKIRSVNDLKRITPGFMMHLYEQGKADVCCAVDNFPNYYPMQFRKIDGTIMATDDYDIEHEVPFVLQTPQEFKHYTQQCYQLITV